MRGMGRLRQAKRKIQRIAFNSLSLQTFVDEEEQNSLEKHMGFPGQWQEHRRFQLAFVKEHGVIPTSRFLEFGSGPLTLGLPLIDYLDKNKYVGVDIRPNVTDIAHNQVAKHGLAWKNPRLIVSDDFAADELADKTFDFVFSFSMLFHLKDQLVERLFAVIAERLTPTGCYWGNINNVDMPESTWLKFPFVGRSPEFYGAIAEQHGMTMKSLGSLEDNGFRLKDKLERHNVLLEFRLR